MGTLEGADSSWNNLRDSLGGAIDSIPKATDDVYDPAAVADAAYLLANNTATQEAAGNPEYGPGFGALVLAPLALAGTALLYLRGDTDEDIASVDEPIYHNTEEDPEEYDL